MQIRILVLTLVLQVLLVSCETASKDTVPQTKNAEDKHEFRISTIPLRSEKTPRFIIRRVKPHLVQYNVVKTPLHTLGFDNRNDNGASLTESSGTARADSFNSTAPLKQSQSKVAKDESTIQSKSDIIDYGSLNDDHLYAQHQHQQQQQQQQHHQQYKTQSLYDYNTMHHPQPYHVSSTSSSFIPQERGQSPKYSDAPKLEYLHAYQFTDEQQDNAGITGQELVDDIDYPKQRLGPQLQQLQQLQVQQPQVSEVEISKSKQYSYTIRKPEHTQFHSSFHQPQAAQLQQQQPQTQALYQTQSHPQQQQFSTFGRETAFLKQTPSTVVPQHQHQQEEFKFQRVNRPPVEKEPSHYDDDTKPVHIHHHYPVQHTEEAEQPENAQQIQQLSQYAQSQSQPQPVRSQFHPSAHGNTLKTQFTPNQFPINNEQEAPTPKPYSQGYQHNHQAYIPARKPTKQPWQETPSYDVPTTTTKAPKWENPHHVDNTKPQHEEDRDRPQVVYPNNIRIEIPEEEIYKHIQNSVHQIIRDLKEKRTKEHNRGKPLISQDQSWSKFIMQQQHHQQEESKAEKHQRLSYNRSSAGAFESAFNPSKPAAEKNPFALENTHSEEKPRDQFHHQNQQPQLFHPSLQRINSRLQHEEEKPFMGPNKFQSFRFEENYSAPPNPPHFTEATQYENGFPRETVSTTVDITMKNPKKAPVIDLNALDVGQTWNHDSHFESQDFKNDHTQAFFNQNSHNRPSPSPSSTSHQYHSQPANLTNNPFASTIQPLYDQSRATPPRVQSNFHHDNNGNGMAFVGSAINVKDPFPLRTATPTPAFFKASQPAPEPEVPEVDIMHGLLPVVNQFTDNGNRVMKVILDPSKMPRELVHDGPTAYPQDFANHFPGNVQTIQYNMNRQHLSIPMMTNQHFAEQPQQSQQQQQQSYMSYPKERKTKAMTGWANNIPEGSANVIQYLPPPPLPSSRNLLPYDSYSPIYNDDMSLGKAISATIMRNKRHRGSEEYTKKVIRTYPRNGKKVKTVKILEPSTEMKPPPKFNKFNKKSSSA